LSPSQLLASTLHSWQTHRNWISIHLVLPRGWKWHSNNFLCKKQTNKQRNRKCIWKVIAICLKSMQYSETLPYGHRGNTAVSSLRYLAPFVAAWQNSHHFLVKKPSLIRSPVNTANFFWPISDHINRVPLYFQINQQSNHFFFLINQQTSIIFSKKKKKHYLWYM